MREKRSEVEKDWMMKKSERFNDSNVKEKDQSAKKNHRIIATSVKSRIVSSLSPIVDSDKVIINSSLFSYFVCVSLLFHSCNYMSKYLC